MKIYNLTSMWQYICCFAKQSDYEVFLSEQLYLEKSKFNFQNPCLLLNQLNVFRGPSQKRNQLMPNQVAQPLRLLEHQLRKYLPTNTETMQL